MPPDGPVDPTIQSAHYPAGAGWWLGPDELWHPPPEPPDPVTDHRVGERKRTWNGVAEWNGTAWHVLEDSVAYAHAPPSPGATLASHQIFRTRLVALGLIATTFVFSFSRLFPVVVGKAACSQDLTSPSSILVCVPDFNHVYTYTYTWWGLSTTYDPWLFSISRNGKSVLFYVATFACLIWALAVLRYRTSKRRLIYGAVPVFALLVAADTVNLLQLSTFTDEWGRQSFCSYLTCHAAVQYWSVALTIGLSAVLMLTMLLALNSIEPDHADDRHATGMDLPSGAWDPRS